MHRGIPPRDHRHLVPTLGANRDPGPGTALRVRIHEQHPETARDPLAREIHGDRGLARSSFLSSNSNDHGRGTYHLMNLGIKH